MKGPLIEGKIRSERLRGAHSQPARTSKGLNTNLSELPDKLSSPIMNSMKLVIPLHLLYWSIHTKDESKRGTAFAFIFGVN